MAATATLVTSGGLPYRIVGNQKETIVDVAMDATYVTGGEVVTAAQLGLQKVDSGTAVVKSATGAGVNVASAFFDEVNLKVLLYDETPAQVANGADVSTTVVRVVARGA